MSLWPQWGSKPYIAESICGILKVLSANGTVLYPYSLYAYCFHLDNNQVVIRKANGVSFLKQAINQHSNVASVVQQACTCLWYLSLKGIDFQNVGLFLFGKMMQSVACSKMLFQLF